MTVCKYQVNEIFYSLQGEGRWAGRPAVFIRFSGCNLRCPFCDTDFSRHTPMTLHQILDAIATWSDCHFVVLTGGEPSLQVDPPLLDALHAAGYYVAIETNGTRPLPPGIDWVTVSPKQSFTDEGRVVLTQASEVKVIFDGIHQPTDCGIHAHEYRLQPCDTGDAQRNATIRRQCVDYILRNPRWQLSLQQHKLLDIK